MIILFDWHINHIGKKVSILDEACFQEKVASYLAGHMVLMYLEVLFIIINGFKIVYTVFFTYFLFWIIMVNAVIPYTKMGRSWKIRESWPFRVVYTYNSRSSYCSTRLFGKYCLTCACVVGAGGSYRIL